ncbi:hypothetical protein [Leptospira interrogans]|uniref:hypothetical protein n=1 Tax=Leptospira interrogans TaxID=173 RepID=UPI00051A806B|nr:hypothetical protein [Leptospira interrogans]MBE0302170.1 hypothetical protein [Leptospira interrogans serovar Yeoncheon]
MSESITITINFEFESPEIPGNYIDNAVPSLAFMLQAREAYKKSIMQYLEGGYPDDFKEVEGYVAESLEQSLTNPGEIEKAIAERIAEIRNELSWDK